MVRYKLEPGANSPIEASPYRRENGRRVAVENRRKATVWRARCQYCTEDGARIEVARWAKTKPDAVKAVEDALDEIRLKDAAEEDSVLTPTTPFVDAGAVWLDWIQRPEARPARGGLSERTKREYRSHYYRHIDAVGSPLRGRTIAQVNEPQRIILFLQRIADSSGNASAKMSRSVLSGILGLCLRRGVIRVNFAATIGAVSTATPKQSVRNRKRAFTRAERTEVLTHADALAQAATNLRTQRKWAATADLMSLMAGTGARINEARLLLWEDVDLIAGRVRIRGTKTTSSDRINNLPQWLIERLHHRRQVMLGWKHPDPFVFSLGFPEEHVLANGLRRYGPNNVPPGDSNLGKWVRDVLDGAGFTWAIPHTFRRTVATLLSEAGVPVGVIADQLGHADASMTMSVYLGRDPLGDKSEIGPLL
ncbi:site-specific integrase [Propioniciclava sinopodophylli]|uniref:Site-specific integrase n=1 Tax=Propioniciclava sinopodophylli TaxID=1837344 RepID=A0A4Q9KFV1_9ACTN|nr:site-specific integrase [Propioniciclava sinopodophylli]TBT86502.1 site-specific integrase [Propioniciclava sinopodophylli]